MKDCNHIKDCKRKVSLHNNNVKEYKMFLKEYRKYRNKVIFNLIKLYLTKYKCKCEAY